MITRNRLPLIVAGLRGPQLEGTLRLGAERISQGAEERVHVRSGDLRDAVHVERNGPLEYAVVAGDDDVFYGHLEEHGSSHSAPHPFLIPALEQEAKTIVAGVAATIARL